MWSIAASGRVRFLVKIWKFLVIKSAGSVRPVPIKGWAGRVDKGMQHQ